MSGLSSESTPSTARYRIYRTSSGRRRSPTYGSRSLFASFPLRTTENGLHTKKGPPLDPLNHICDYGIHLRMSYVRASRERPAYPRPNRNLDDHPLNRRGEVSVRRSFVSICSETTYHLSYMSTTTIHSSPIVTQWCDISAQS